MLLLVDKKHLVRGEHKARVQLVIGSLLSSEEIKDKSKRVLTIHHRVVERFQTLGVLVIGNAIGTISIVSQQRILVLLLMEVVFSSLVHLKVWDVL